MCSKGVSRLNGLMTSQVAGRSAVVTGSARGIGRAIAEALVGAGYEVVVADLNAAQASATAHDIGAAAGIAMDVRDPQAHRNVAELAESIAPLAVWVNNAGVGFDGDLADLSDEHVRGLIEVNLLGVAWGMRAALSTFDGHGDIVNVASLSGHGPVPGLSVYAATKAGVVSLTGSVANEVPRGVRVHAICPDGVSTAMVDEMKAGGRAKELVASGGHLLMPADVAQAVMGMIGSHRTIRTLPAWGGAMLRAGALAPGTMKVLEPVLRAQGRRRLKK
jgi:NAD(P)-dependent dehydrogenase (short-subunit alcohol dehydrogenase family)